MRRAEAEHRSLGQHHYLIQTRNQQKSTRPDKICDEPSRRE